ncbi:MAG: C-GCAxxG-C-C family protein [Clostridiales Family XIII bacterium]|nr:C-GCAxxG-C-C family protein [Clostridiales Family XIII bacterium]
MDVQERVLEERLKGHCCSESIMNMCLEDMGGSPGQNRSLVKAMGAFCGGLHEGLACGTLCAAMAVLSIAEDGDRKAGGGPGPEMMKWFRKRFGAWNCAELLEGDESRKLTLCPAIVCETYLKLRDMLEELGAV